MSGSSSTFEVHYKDWTSKLSVHPSGTDQQLYFMNTKGCTRQYTITKGSDQLIGSFKLHTISSRIDVETRSEEGIGNTFELRNDKILVGSPRYTSPAFDKQLMVWKNKAMSSKIIYTLIDGNGQALANFESSPKTKIGKLEILDVVVGNDKINEIVVTLLALLLRKLQTIQASTIVAIS